MYIDINSGAAGTHNTMFDADGSRAAAGWSVFASCAGMLFHAGMFAPIKQGVDMDKHYIKILVAVGLSSYVYITHTYKHTHKHTHHTTHE